LPAHFVATEGVGSHQATNMALQGRLRREGRRGDHPQILSNMYI